jgi:hypothetical protein
MLSTTIADSDDMIIAAKRAGRILLRCHGREYAGTLFKRTTGGFGCQHSRETNTGLQNRALRLLRVRTNDSTSEITPLGARGRSASS